MGPPPPPGHNQYPWTAPASQLVAEDGAKIAEKQPVVDVADRVGATSTARFMILLNYTVILRWSIARRVIAGARGQRAKSVGPLLLVKYQRLDIVKEQTTFKARRPFSAIGWNHILYCL